jgi:hypothetical protein
MHRAGYSHVRSRVSRGWHRYHLRVPTRARQPAPAPAPDVRARHAGSSGTACWRACLSYKQHHHLLLALLLMLQAAPPAPACARACPTSSTITSSSALRSSSGQLPDLLPGNSFVLRAALRPPPRQLIRPPASSPTSSSATHSSSGQLPDLLPGNSFVLRPAPRPPPRLHEETRHAGRSRPVGHYDETVSAKAAALGGVGPRRARRPASGGRCSLPARPLVTKSVRWPRQVAARPSPHGHA